MTTESTPTTPPIAVLAAYWNAPVSYEAIRKRCTPEQHWVKKEGTVNETLLHRLMFNDIRNVQLQLRGIEDMTYDEHYNLFIEAVGVFMGDLTIRNTPKECLQIIGEVRTGVTKTLTIWADGEWAIECNKNDGPLLNVVAAINYLRSIQIDIDGLGVARKEGARGG
jgi:hypothetical protein